MGLQVADIHSELVQKCKQGEREAQHQLYELYSKQMFSVSLRILNNREEAEDVLQEAFVDIFTKINTFKGKSTIGAWIRQIVVNKSINKAKRKKLETTTIDGKEEVLTEEQMQNANVSFPFSVEQVKQAIKELPDGYRMVFSLFMFEGWSHRQIAQELGVAESTSKSQYNRAKKKIVDILNQNFTTHAKE